MKIPVLLTVALAACQAQAKSLSNAKDYTVANWQAEFLQAKNAKLDGFALNMAYNDATNDEALSNAFKAAEADGGIKLFFTLDYEGGSWGPWPQAAASSIINMYKNHASYYKYNGKPVVSTFEGAGYAQDWKTIKAETGSYFIPNYYSIGAQAAMNTGVADGLFNWGAWTEGPNEGQNTVDESYRAALGGKSYMMPVSPWYFSNLPAFRKNWLWRGDDLWYDRWISVFTLQPEFVQILSWNNYGESSYIGPLPQRETSWEIFDRGMAPFNYAKDKTHSAWRLFLPFLVDLYKTGAATVTREGIVSWYRQTEGAKCDAGETTGNSALHGQTLYAPTQLVRDKIFYDVLLGSAADVSVTIGGVAVTASFENTPDGNVGIFHGSASFTGRSGPVVITITRGSTIVAQLNGPSILATCPNSVQNWNPVVVSSQAAGNIAAKATPKDSLKYCVAGRGRLLYGELCQFACKYDYCPSTCTCTALASKPLARPVSVAVVGCPKEGLDASYSGLCSMACGLGTCPSNACVKKAAGSKC